MLIKRHTVNYVLVKFKQSFNYIKHLEIKWTINYATISRYCN